MSERKKILMIFTEWGLNEYRKKHNKYGGVGYYRIVKPAEYLRQYYDVDVVGADIAQFGSTSAEVWGNVFTKYDLVYPRHVDAARAASDMLAAADYFKKPVLLDLDDNYLEVRESSPAYEHYHPGSAKRTFTSTVITLVNGVTVSTEPLRRAYGKKNKKVYVLPNCNDVNDWPGRTKTWGDDMIRIGWAGSTTHDEDLDIIVEPMKYILEHYPNVLFEVMGGIPKEKVEWFKKRFGVPERVIVHYGTPAWDGYPQLLADKGWDIGIIPLADNNFTICKSHIKWMEYAMVGLPSIASKVYPYYKDIQGTKTIQDKKTGLLVKNTFKEWTDAIEYLIQNPEARKDLHANALTYIEQNWQWSQHIHKWKKVIDKFI